MTLKLMYQAFQSNLATLSSWTQQQFTDLAASIAAGWNVEHTAEGHHSAITATSAAVSGQVRANNFSIGSTLYPDILSADVTTVWYPPGSETAGSIFVRSSGGVTIYGLSIEGRQVGDVVAFINGNQSVDGISLRLFASTLAGQAGTFKGNGSIPDTDVSIPCGRWVWLIVSLNSPNSANAKLFWRVSHF